MIHTITVYEKVLLTHQITYVLGAARSSIRQFSTSRIQSLGDVRRYSLLFFLQYLIYVHDQELLI